MDFVVRHPRGSAEFFAAAIRGAIPGVSRVTFGGFNQDIDTGSTPEDIWGGDGLIPRPSAAESWEIVSSNASDAIGGTGARTVTITTLDGSYAPVTQTVILNGTTAVALSGTHRFLNVGNVATAGSGGAPAGTLTIRVAGGGAARGYIGTDGSLNQAKYTVPNGFTLELHSTVFALRTVSGTTESVIMAFVVTNQAGRSLSSVRFPLAITGANIYRHEIAAGLVPFNRLTARTEVSIRGTLVTANNVVADASTIGLLYDNSLWP